MTTQKSEPTSVSIRARVTKLFRWLLALSLTATLLVGLAPYPIERSGVDPSAPKEDSDYVTVNGLPFYFAVTDRTITHRPAASVLVRHFAINWGLAFALFLSPIILFESIRLAAFYAARGVRSVCSEPDNSKANQTQ